MNEELIQLENKINELTQWKDSIVKERLLFPLDIESTVILNRGILRSSGKQLPITDAFLVDLASFGFQTIINGDYRLLPAYVPFRSFTVNAGTDVITDAGGSHNLKTNDFIAVTSTGTLPVGLEPTFFYVIYVSTNTFKVSLTPDGSAVDITSAGVGTHYYASNLVY